MPRLKCVNCGETKISTRFPKRGGLTYEKLLPTDPRRYDSQCKLCKKNRPANAGPDYVHKEPLLPIAGAKRFMKKKKKRGRPPNPSTKGLSRAEAKQKRCIETRIKSMQYLSGKGCEECGERDPRKLEYDHKDPSDKSRSVSKYITDGYSWASAVLRAEIRKCRILCASCHRVHTIQQQGYYATEEVKEALRDIAAEYGFKS